jgi:acyl-lipid omega-6 desaturase (Delta-12 desaturase)
VMFGLGPVYAMVIQPRLPSRSARPRTRRSVIVTDVALVLLIGLLCGLMGWREYLLVQRMSRSLWNFATAILE